MTDIVLIENICQRSSAEVAVSSGNVSVTFDFSFTKPTNFTRILLWPIDIQMSRLCLFTSIMRIYILSDLHAEARYDTSLIDTRWIDHNFFFWAFFRLFPEANAWWDAVDRETCSLDQEIVYECFGGLFKYIEVDSGESRHPMKVGSSLKGS